MFVGTVKRYSKPRKTAGTGGRAFLGQEIFEAVDSGLTRGLAWLESAVLSQARYPLQLPSQLTFRGYPQGD